MSIPTDLLDSGRMDLDYYRPKFVEALARVHKSGFLLRPLDKLRDPERIITDGIRKHTKTESGVVLIRTQNFEGVSLNLDDCVYVDLAQHKAALKSAVRPSDLLIAIRGYLGKAAIVSPNLPTANINQHIARIAVDPRKVDSGYLWAFFSSPTGASLLEQQVTGTVQQGITLPALRQLSIPLPPRSVQDYIGAKVRLAEDCRARARELLSEAKRRFAEILHPEKFSPSNTGFGFVDRARLTERLAAEFYLPAYLDLERHLRSINLPVVPIAELLRSSIVRTSTPDRVDFEAIPCILTSDIDPQQIDYVNPSLWIQKETHKLHKGKLEPFDVVYTSVGPPVGEAALVLPEYLPMAVGGDVSVLRVVKDVSPGYFCLYLNSIFGQMQNERYARGIRQRRVYPDDIGSFLIPVLEKADQDYIGSRVTDYERLNDRAAVLVREAKADVEALIEGQLDVDGIVAGQLRPPTWEEIAV